MAQHAPSTGASAAHDPGAAGVRIPQPAVPVPRAVWLALLVNVGGVALGAWMFLNAFILLDETAPAALLALAVMNAALMITTGRRMRRLRVVEEQRRFTRVGGIELEARLNGESCRVTELSLGGCQVEIRESHHSFDVRQSVTLEFALQGIAFNLEGEIAGAGKSARGTTHLRVTFLPGQDGYINRLATGMLTEEGDAWAA